MNVRSIRGPNWVQASVRVTIMTEKTTPTTVMSDPASDDRICLAASGEPLITQDGRLISRWKAAWSIVSVAREQQHHRHGLDGRDQPGSCGASRCASPTPPRTAGDQCPLPTLVMVEAAADQTSRLTWV